MFHLRVAFWLIPVTISILSPEIWAEEPARSSQQVAMEWTGSRHFRVIVAVPPAKDQTRPVDIRPAEVFLDFEKMLAKQQLDGLPDLRTLQVVRIDSKTATPLPYDQYRYATSRFDRPFRWLDSAIPDEFPEFEGDIRRFGGKITRTPSFRRGAFLGTIGDWKQGHLTWEHTAEKNQTIHYAIYFDLLPTTVPQPPELPPRSWLGDGLPRCDFAGRTSTGFDHCRIETVDWDGDQLVDIVLGENYGHVVWYRNIGTATQPRFGSSRILFDCDNLPLDAGMTCAPKVVDWDNDGRDDLLIGTDRNRIMYYRNIGSNTDRQLQYQGVLKIDGAPLELPVTPVAIESSSVFTLDYYPVLETVDWDNDGDIDLLAGGAITGRIYFFENESRDANGLPRLRLQGPLEADGKPLNVSDWFAAPAVFDLDADGDLDLICGTMPLRTPLKHQNGNEGFLRFFLNEGTRTTPKLTEKPFPRTGLFPRVPISTPRLTDWDNDGDMDLVVSNRHDLFLFENTGTRQAPQFAVHNKPLPNRWGKADVPARQFLDWNGDGHADIFLASQYEIRLNSGTGNPGKWSQRIKLLPPGKTISHPSKIGDDWFRPYLVDFDTDGHIDILFGDWFGHVWLHRNLSNKAETKFDIEGEKLKLANGQAIRVGPIGGDIKSDFTALQGARTDAVAADIDGDRRTDLIVSDTLGMVRLFRNVGDNRKPVFAPPIEIGNLKVRAKVTLADWNEDGLPDILASSASGGAWYFRNRCQPNNIAFDTQKSLNLPKSIKNPQILTVDLNNDGDRDLYVQTNLGSCYLERSFLKSGYSRGEVLRFEHRPNHSQ